MNALLWKLHTVFIDGDCEKEGRNIEANVTLLIDAFQCLGGLHEASKHDDGLDDQFQSICLRTAVGDSICSERRESSAKPACRIVRKKSTLCGSNSSGSLSLVPAPSPPTVAGSPPSVRSLLYGVAQLSRIIPNHRRAGQLGNSDAPLRCPHCKLFEDDPKFYHVPVAADGKSVLARVRARYGNLALGIVSKEMALDQLWLAVAKLQLPTYASLTTEQCAHSCREHFLSRIGVPPWMEHLLNSERAHRRQVDTLRAELDTQKEQNAEVVNEIGRQRKFLELTKSLQDTMNQEHERMALLGQLQVAKAELVDKRWQLEEAQRKNSRDAMHHDVYTALIALRVEETQRLLTSLAMLNGVLNDLVRARDSSEDAIRVGRLDLQEKLRDTLGNFPSAEFGRSCRRSAGANKHPVSRYVQCKNCLLPLSYSPFCGATGFPHHEQMDETYSMDNSRLPSDEIKPPPSPELSHHNSSASTSDSGESTVPLGGTSMEGVPRASGRQSLRRIASNVSSRPSSTAQLKDKPDPSAAESETKSRRRRRRVEGRNKTGRRQHGGGDDTPSTVTGGVADSSTMPGGGGVSSRLHHPAAAESDIAADTAAVNEVFQLFATHTCQFLEAASRSDFSAMRTLVEELDGTVAISPATAVPGDGTSLHQKFPATCSAIVELEERFLEWMYALSLDPPPLNSSISSPPSAPSPSASGNVVQEDATKIVRLKKELRELQHSFAKRPNARSQGINLDEEGYAAVAFRIAELERKIAQSKGKLKELSSNTTSINSKLVSEPCHAALPAPQADVVPPPPDATTAHTPQVGGPPKAPPAKQQSQPVSRAVRVDFGSKTLSL